MIDILYKVHEVISQDRIIREHVNINNIKFNKYPNVKDTDVPFIVIDDIDDPIPQLILTEMSVHIVILSK